MAINLDFSGCTVQELQEMEREAHSAWRDAIQATNELETQEAQNIENAAQTYYYAVYDELEKRLYPHCEESESEQIDHESTAQLARYGF